MIYNHAKEERKIKNNISAQDGTLSHHICAGTRCNELVPVVVKFHAGHGDLVPVRTRYAEEIKNSPDPGRR